MSDIADDVLAAGRAILTASPEELTTKLAETLQRFVSSDFSIGAGPVFDATGNSTPSYPIVLYRADGGLVLDDDKMLGYPADSVAAVIELCDELDLDRFRQAYESVSKVKLLGKPPILHSEGAAKSNITLGIVFSIRSSVSLDALADELYRLNVAVPHRRWLDMLVVATSGTVNYAIQFPGESLAGDFLPPAQGAFSPPAPPAFYVTIVMNPLGEQSFNKLLAFVIGHLVFFSPDLAAKQLDWSLLTKRLSAHVITTLGFQPNLTGQLVPVPSEGYTGKFIPSTPVLLEGADGQILAALTYFKWQQGGVVILAGKLPLEGLLVFLPNPRAEYLRVMKRPTHQISPVLPMSPQQFNQFISNILQRSNLKVRSNPGGIVMEKFLDEGTTVPFVARCMLGLMRIRENAISDDSRREDFDKRFQSALSSLMTAREASKNLGAIWRRHVERVASGEAAHIEGANIRVVESINKSLSDEFETFLNAAARAIKTGVQGLCTFLHIEVGFLFKKQSSFEFGIERLRKADRPLAEYLAQARRWTERLIMMRNDLEHEIWEFPKVSYSFADGRVRAAEPQIKEERVTTLVEFLLDRTICFFEEVIIHGLQSQLTHGSTITEIARGLRTAESPERFRLTLKVGGEPEWRIAYHASKFDDT